MRREALVRSAAALGITLVLVVGYWYVRSPEATRVKVGQLAPDLALPTMGAAMRTRLSSFRGRPVLLVMFMSGCHICEEEMNDVERLHRHFNLRGLVVLGVSADADDATTADFAKRHEITFFVMRDPGALELRKTYGREDQPYRVPEAYLIDPAGKVNAIFLGSAEWQRGVKERIEKLLPVEGPVVLPR